MSSFRVLADILTALRRRVLLHRRPIAAVLAALATWVVVQAATAPPPATVPVWTAARDLPSGTVLERGDLHRAGFAPDSVPDAAVREAGPILGRTLATPLGRGEPVTPAHLAGAERLAGYPDRVAMAVRIPDADVVALLAPGQRVDLLGTDPQGAGPAEPVADDVAVLAVPRSSTGPDAGALSGRLVVLAVPRDRAEELAAAATTRYLSVVWSRAGQMP